MIGSRIRQFRMERGLSISELAEKADIAKSYLSSLERNLKNNPTYEYILKIAKALDVDQETLLFGENTIQDEKIPMDYFSTLRKYIMQIDERELEELKDYIEFTLWKKREK